MSQTSDAATSETFGNRFAFDPQMASVDLDSILNYPPFSDIDATRFPNGTNSIATILRQDCRLRTYRPGDVLIRKGEYSNSAYIVLRGGVQIILDDLEFNADANEAGQFWSLWQRLVASVAGPSAGNALRRINRSARQTHLAGKAADGKLGLRDDDTRAQTYLQDIDAVVRGSRSEPITAGGIFGEMAAMTRSANDYTAVALESTTVLEVRWQGLRQLRRDLGFRTALDQRYRETGLQSWLHSHPLLEYCPSESIATIAQRAELLSFGEREWFVQYNRTKQADLSSKIASEPLICSEGEHANTLCIIRSGFGRLSYQFGHSHRTIAYLAKGQSFGLAELAHNARLPNINQYLPFQYSLRALGYLDLIRIDRETVREHILPYCRDDSLPASIDRPRLDRFGTPVDDEKSVPPDNLREEPLMEFLVESRLINAAQAMVINTDRCTRCDDCVRACATAHQGVSRFSRTGPTFENFQFTESCMHCIDPVCMIGCPTGAIRRDQETGIVSINAPTCIGCRTCADSCPYNNIVMEVVNQGSPARGLSSDNELPIVASKCDLCQNLAAGPACVAACPHEALERVDLSNTQSLKAWLAEQ